jgi:hypothetical protein
MSSRANRAHVTVERHRLRSLRISLGATRWVLYAVALVGVVSAARDAVAPPRARPAIVPAPRPSDAGAEWFALSFARAYLTWSADPSTHEAAMQPFVLGTDDPDAGLSPATGGAEQVNWLAIAGERDEPDGLHDYTVAAGTGGGAVRYLSVAVATAAGGEEVLARYPALVTAPTPGRAGELDGAGLPTLNNAEVIAVLERAARNYVDSSSDNLAADLATGATVAPVATGLTLRSVLRLAVEPSGAVLATLVAADARGDLFTVAYEFTVRLIGSRWEITRIQP